MQELDDVSADTVYRTLKEVLQVYQQRKEDKQIFRNERQQAGIQAGRRLGRPAIAYPRSWKHVLGQWQAREISAADASRKLKMSRSTFYRMVKRYRQGENGGHEGCLL